MKSLNDEEWELLCDHCGRCCLKKLQDESSGQIAWTRIVCRFYQSESAANGAGGCGCYDDRQVQVPDCLDVRTMSKADSRWMPDTCAYRLRMEGQPLPDWHPLIQGDRIAMEQADIPIEGKALSEEHVHPMGYHEHVIRWVNAEESGE